METKIVVVEDARKESDGKKTYSLLADGSAVHLFERGTYAAIDLSTDREIIAHRTGNIVILDLAGKDIRLIVTPEIAVRLIGALASIL